MNIHKITFTLLVIGGLNWGLEALNYGLGSWSFVPNWLSVTIYVLVALSAIYEIFAHKKLCKNCNVSSEGAL